MQVNKCDRCGKTPDDTVEFMFVNRGVITETETPFGLQTEFLNKNWELCYSCGTEVARWLSHQENDLPIVRSISYDKKGPQTFSG